MTTTPSADVVPAGSGPGTDLVTRLEGMTIPATLSANYPALDVESDALGAVLENVGGEFEDLPLGQMPRIKFPTGGDTLFNVPDATNPNGVRQDRELVGIIVGNRPRRAFWPSVRLTGDRPSCFSLDGKNGDGDFGPGSARNPSGKCRKCPMAEYGTKGQLDGALPDSRGQACKQTRLLYILTGGTVLPFQLQAPPTSLGRLDAWLLNLGGSGVPFHAIEVSFRLNQVAGENPYAVLDVSTKRKLEPDEAAVTKVYADTLKWMLDQSGVDDVTREMHQSENIDPESGEDEGGVAFGDQSEAAAAGGFENVDSADEGGYDGKAAGAARKNTRATTTG